MRFLFSIVAVISFGLTFAQKTIKVIDLIEIENGTENEFNFYGIRLDDDTTKYRIY